MTKTGEVTVLFDLANKVRKVKRSDTGSVEMSLLPAETITGIENMLTGS